MASFPGSPPLASSPPAPSLPLIVLTDDELQQAPHEVLVSLVARLQHEHARAAERVERLEHDAAHDRDERRRLDKELDGARTRVDELLADQARMDEELGGRIEVLDKLRASVRTLEREKRDATKRYREQSETFESERQAWYDQEQHYKLRLSNLATGGKRPSRTSSRKPAPAAAAHDDRIDEDDEPPETPRADLVPLSRSATSSPSPSASSTRSDTASTSATSESTSSPSAAELAVRDQLDTLTTAHSSLSSTLHKLQVEMADLKRVYQDVQEQNESYEVLLGERTLSGEVRTTALFRQSFSWGESGLAGDGVDGADWLHGGGKAGDVKYASAFGFAGGLDPVGEEGELPLSSDEELSSDGDGEVDDEDEDEIERVLLESKGVGSPHSGAVAAERAERRRSRHAAKRASLVAAAGGLDLAAELEAAAEQDEGDEGAAERLRAKEERRDKRQEDKRRKKAAASQQQRDGSLVGLSDVELHNEVRQLRDANKALTLYVSKIVDRVCSQEGFEKVLAVDYRNTPKPADALASPETPGPPLPDKKPRPASIGFFRSTAPSSSTPSGAAAASTPVRRTDPSTPLSTASFVTAPSATPASPTVTGPRKSGGGVWDSVASVFSLGRSTSSATGPPSSPAVAGGIKPLVLADAHARKVEFGDEFEDDEDRRERERIRAEMVTLGFDPPPTSRLAAAAPGGGGGGALGASSRTTSPVPSPSLGGRSPGESSLREHERARALEALEKQDAARRTTLTELPQRRMSLLGQQQRRQGSRASLSASTSPSPSLSLSGDVGLGIGLDGAAATQEGTSSSPPPASASEGGARKALRRLSSAWSSPPLGS
ncbi:hypothetical protein JCM9279_003725 [Rhodotorula babjevae]